MLCRLVSRSFSTRAPTKEISSSSSLRPIRDPKPYRIITKDPSAPQPLILKKTKLSKLPAPIATLSDQTTVHLNVTPEPVYTSPETLPPLSHRFLPTTRLTPAQIEEIKTLRESDPKAWTVRKLAKKYNVNPVFISRYAPCPPERRLFLKKREEVRLSLLSMGSLLAMERRKKLRELW